MKISILCTDRNHPINDELVRWSAAGCSSHTVEIVRSVRDLPGGEILFLVSCSEIVHATDRAKYRATLVLHASDLPKGRGWSPHIWEILGGADQITVTLLEADSKVDSGRIWAKRSVHVPRDLLWDDINRLLFKTELELMDFAIVHIDDVQPTVQDLGIEPTYYRKRTPEDSELDPSETIESQFDLLRVCDPSRFPAYIRLRGMKYKIVLEKCHD